LKEVRKYADPKGSLFCIEVPCERYQLWGIFMDSFFGRIYEAYLRSLLRLPFLMKSIDFISTLFRLKLNFVPPFGFVKLHEHINFFDENSLQALLKKSGFSILLCRTYRENRVFGFGASILCLARAS
ncbi:MAG: hypothetical protein Q7S00_05805, partial [bacterium]|nr:hypothetical protein [bacterium]